MNPSARVDQLLDLRRSFGERWAARIMPPDLMLLMRHESIETTLRFYVGRSAQRTAKTLWEAHKKAQSGNSGQIRSDWADTSNDATPAAAKHFLSTPSRIRTCDLRIRSPLLYPAELWAQSRQE